MRIGPVLLALLVAALWGFYGDDALFPERSWQRQVPQGFHLLMSTGLFVIVVGIERLRNESDALWRLMLAALIGSLAIIGAIYGYDRFVAGSLAGWLAEVVRIVLIAALLMGLARAVTRGAAPARAHQQ